jgi:hypothetical protein
MITLHVPALPVAQLLAPAPPTKDAFTPLRLNATVAPLTGPQAPAAGSPVLGQVSALASAGFVHCTVAVTVWWSPTASVALCGVSRILAARVVTVSSPHVSVVELYGPPAAGW